MKIEKLNENQIRCTLNRRDLEERQIKLSELAYGSEKAKELFRDMIRQANEEFGFEVNDIPIMVEAIPASQETLVLVISKVEYPDELDNRFSKFSDGDEDDEEEALVPSKDPMEELLSKQGASDILDLFRQMKDELQADQKKGKASEAAEEASEESSKESSEEKKESLKTSKEAEEGEAAGRRKKKMDLIRLFAFRDLSEAEALAHVLDGFYEGKSDLYRDTDRSGYYFLFLHKAKHTPEEFNKVCNIAAEYGTAIGPKGVGKAFLEEHGRVIRRGDALQMLAQL